MVSGRGNTWEEITELEYYFKGKRVELVDTRGKTYRVSPVIVVSMEETPADEVDIDLEEMRAYFSFTEPVSVLYNEYEDELLVEPM